MLPGPLVSVYQRYKADTDFVASWLATTARACGYPADLLSEPGYSEPKPKSGRVKGKARKTAPKKATAAKTTASSKHILALADFLPLANHIANSTKPLVQVPDVFSIILSRPIDVRSGLGSRMEGHGVELDPAKDESHQFFVGVLEAVRDALRPRMSINAAEAAAGVVEDARKDQPPNRFEFLDVYEPSQAFLDAPPAKQPQKDSRDDVVYEAEPQTSQEDLLFAFVLLMEDLNKMRAQIQQLWSNHGIGNGDLAAVAVATNTAVEFAHGLIDEMLPLFKDVKNGTFGLATEYNALLCQLSGLDPVAASAEVSTNTLSNKTYEIAQKSFIITYMLLCVLPEIIDPSGIPLYKQGIFGVYDPESDRRAKTDQQKLNEDKIVILEFFTEAMIVIRSDDSDSLFPAQDEFMRALKEIDKTRQVPFYSVFAAQVMTTETGIMANGLAKHLEFHKDLKTDSWTANHDRIIKETEEYINWIGGDPIFEAKVGIYSQVRGWGADPVTKHRLLKYSPVVSGLILLRFRASVHEISIAVINAWGSVAYPAHLYNALQKSGPLKPGLQSQDMDITLDLLGDSNFWVGEGDNHRPDNLRAYFNRFCMQMGVTTAAFADPRKRRGWVNLRSRGGARGIDRHVSVVSAMFDDRYRNHPESGIVDWTPEHVENILARSAFEIKGDTIEQIDDPAKLREKRAKAARQRKAAGKAVDKRDGAARRVPPTELITALFLTLDAESLELAFPYLVLHRTPWRLLRLIKEKCDPLLMHLYTPVYLKYEYELPWVVGWIFIAAVGVPPATPYDGIRLLRIAAQVVNDFLESETQEAACKIAKQMGIKGFTAFESESESVEKDAGSNDDLPDLIDANLRI
ncbi:hypothetical protein QBC37DRAFT_481342 [Rhypophila decipiens]|uniref:DUF6604 domain-containing protein n=1 Tax=Rhypophila decipiens TaxID=261697 RepID=A0AAN7B9A4_9PEZI|nr:hypothetical protein QBC37DRAFT_481342 [Rhypophila decipiens]